MNVLYLAHRVPYPPNKGEKTRVFSLVRYLAQDHEVHLVSFCDDRADLVHAERLHEWCASVDVAYRGPTLSKLLGVSAMLAGGRPASVGAFHARQLARKLSARLRTTRIDCVVVSTSSMAAYVEEQPALADIPKVLDFIDVDSVKWRQYAERARPPARWIYGREARVLAAFEERLADAYDLSVFDSFDEGQLLQRRVPDADVRTIPDGIDLEALRPAAQPPAAPPRVVFTGTMSYAPNSDAAGHFADAILPRVREAVPDVLFDIVGRHPPPEITRLGAIEGVTVTGEVPDVLPYLHRAHVAVAPLRIARGLQVKVLEAMATGVPMVGSAQAFLGMQVTPDDGIRVADDPDAFAAAVIDLLTDADQRQRCSEAVRRYVERHHEWRALGAQFESMLREVVERQGKKNGPPPEGGGPRGTSRLTN